MIEDETTRSPCSCACGCAAVIVSVHDAPVRCRACRAAENTRVHHQPASIEMDPMRTEAGISLKRILETPVSLEYPNPRGLGDVSGGPFTESDPVEAGTSGATTTVIDLVQREQKIRDQLRAAFELAADYGYTIHYDAVHQQHGELLLEHIGVLEPDEPDEPDEKVT